MYKNKPNYSREEKKNRFRKNYKEKNKTQRRLSNLQPLPTCQPAFCDACDYLLTQLNSEHNIGLLARHNPLNCSCSFTSHLFLERDFAQNEILSQKQRMKG